MEFVFALYIFLLYYSFQKRGSTILLFLVTIIPFCYAFISSAVADTGIYKASRPERPNKAVELRNSFSTLLYHTFPRKCMHILSKNMEKTAKSPTEKPPVEPFLQKREWIIPQR